MQKKRNEKGVTVVEYAIMLALIAIAVAALNITQSQFLSTYPIQRGVSIRR
jgi:Flp pilus assembly pilin Flp